MPRAAVLHEVGRPLDVQDVDLAAPQPGEVLVRLAAAGVCRSDLHVIDGVWEAELPIVLGHEGSGTVEAVGAGVTAPAVGDRVALSWVTGCGRCRPCAQGRPALCEIESHHGTMPDGTTRLSLDGRPLRHWLAVSCFAEQAVVPATQAVTLPPDADLEVAALVGCAALTGVGAVLNTARVEAGSSAAVFGCGGVGLCAIQGLRVAGATPIVAVDVSDDALELARASGADQLVRADLEDPVRAVRRLTAGGAEYAFEILGRTQTIEQAYAALRPGGRCVIVGMPAYDATITVNAFSLPGSEKAILGSLYGSARPHLDGPLMLDLEAAGRLDLRSLIRRRYPLDAINEAYDDLRAGAPGRGLIVFDRAQ